MLPAPVVTLSTAGERIAEPDLQLALALAGVGLVVVQICLIIRIGNAGTGVVPVMEPAEAEQMDKVPKNKKDQHRIASLIQV